MRYSPTQVMYSPGEKLKSGRSTVCRAPWLSDSAPHTSRPGTSSNWLEGEEVTLMKHLVFSKR